MISMQLEPIAEEHHLNAGIAGMVSMRHRVHNRLGDRFSRQLIGNGRLGRERGTGVVRS